MDMGASGEKIRFLIASQKGGKSVWHAAMSGYSKESSKYRNSLMSGRITWAAYSAYKEMGEDMRHPAIGIDRADPRRCYISIRFKAGLVINVYGGAGKMLFSPSKLPVVDANASGGTDRFAAQWTRPSSWARARSSRPRKEQTTGSTARCGPVLAVAAASRSRIRASSRSTAPMARASAATGWV